MLAVPCVDTEAIIIAAFVGVGVVVVRAADRLLSSPNVGVGTAAVLRVVAGAMALNVRYCVSSRTVQFDDVLARYICEPLRPQRLGRYPKTSRTLPHQKQLPDHDKR